MIELNSKGVLDYCLFSGLVTSEAVVDGSAVITPITGRNRNYSVHQKDRDSFFLKQPLELSEGTIAHFARECLILSRLEESTTLPSIAKLVPRLLRYDAQNSIQITAYLDGAKGFSPTDLAPGAAAEIATQLGAHLRMIHSPTFVPSVLHELNPHYSIPWIFQHAANRPHPIFQLGEAGTFVATFVMQDSAIRHSLRHLAVSWQQQSVVHGDLKLENVLTSSERQLPYVVDWEMSGMGEPNWDIATLIASWFSSEIIRQGTDETSLDAVPSLSFTAAVSALLDAHGMAKDVSSFDRLVRFVSVRMLVCACEYLSGKFADKRVASAILLASRDLLHNPWIIVGR